MTPPDYHPAKSRPPKPGFYLRLWPNGWTAKSHWTGNEWLSGEKGQGSYRSPFQSLPWKEIK